MKNYHLVPDIDRWKLEREADGVIQFFDSKEEAVKRCTEYMGTERGSLTIHAKDGTIEAELTYPRDPDPVKLPG